MIKYTCIPYIHTSDLIKMLNTWNCSCTCSLYLSSKTLWS